MHDIEIWDHIFRTLQENRDYGESAARIQDLEPGYLAVLETLGAEEKELVERYITACEA